MNTLHGSMVGTSEFSNCTLILKSMSSILWGFLISGYSCSFGNEKEGEKERGRAKIKHQALDIQECFINAQRTFECFAHMHTPRATVSQQIYTVCVCVWFFLWRSTANETCVRVYCVDKTIHYHHFRYVWWYTCTCDVSKQSKAEEKNDGRQQ